MLNLLMNWRTILWTLSTFSGMVPSAVVSIEIIVD